MTLSAQPNISEQGQEPTIKMESCADCAPQ